MGLRFRKRITIVPGLSLNISKTGLGLSAGPRGAKIGIGPRGVHRSVGIPGTGLHFREETTWGSLSGSSRSRGSGALSGLVPDAALLRLNDDGSVDLVTPDGTPFPAKAARAFRERNADQIDAFMAKAVAQWNAGIEQILGVHLDTPAPHASAPFEPKAFSVPKPEPFVPRSAGILGFLWPPRRHRVEEDNEAGRRRRGDELRSWHEQRREFEAHEAATRRDLESARAGDMPAMERVLGSRLQGIDWPRETHVSFQVSDRASTLSLDVDLPEVEDMPREEAKVAARGLRLNIRTKSDTQVRRDYMTHIHGILFRIVGEAFYLLPSLDVATASGYSQRPDPTTGHVRDDYLISLRATRAQWESLNFENLQALDLTTCFERFDLRRRMTKTGVFTPIDPHLEGSELPDASEGTGT